MSACEIIEIWGNTTSGSMADPTLSATPLTLSLACSDTDLQSSGLTNIMEISKIERQKTIAGTDFYSGGDLVSDWLSIVVRHDIRYWDCIWLCEDDDGRENGGLKKTNERAALYIPWPATAIHRQTWRHRVDLLRLWRVRVDNDTHVNKITWFGIIMTS